MSTYKITPKVYKVEIPLQVGYYTSLLSRSISEEICRKYKYELGTVSGLNAHIANYVNRDGQVISQHIRFLDKKGFVWAQYNKNIILYGQDVCVDDTKPIIITEGELDAMSCAELGYQSVSIPTGANSATQYIKANLDYLSLFPEIWLCLDNDDEGKLATQEVLKLLQLNKVKIVNLQNFKDANEALLAGKLQEILEASVQEYRPDGIIFGNELDFEELYKPLPEGYKLPFKLVESKTYGLLPGQLWVIAGGTSIGKSTVLRHMCIKFRQDGKKIANIFLEESQRVSPLTYVAHELKLPIGKLLVNPEMVMKEKFQEVCDRLLNTKSLMFVDSVKKNRATYDSDHLLRVCEYLATSQEYDIIILDHISAVISTSKLSKHGERRDIDELMEKLGDLCIRTNVSIIASCHLTKPREDSKGWDEGKKPGIYDLKGSSALSQKPDVILGLSRNMKSNVTKDRMQIEILKNRWFGDIGDADTLYFDENTGLLIE